MKDSLISIFGGMAGAMLGNDIWEIAANALGTVILAFVGGMAGYAGKRFIEFCIKKKKHEKNNK